MTLRNVNMYEKSLKDINVIQDQIKIFLYRLAGSEGRKCSSTDSQCEGKEFTLVHLFLLPFFPYRA